MRVVETIQSQPEVEVRLTMDEVGRVSLMLDWFEAAEHEAGRAVGRPFQELIGEFDLLFRQLDSKGENKYDLTWKPDFNGGSRYDPQI